jgi:L-2-hydroxycarboxylate dehydrogenase (NAD+)
MHKNNQDETFSAISLRQFTTSVFEYFNVPHEDALLAADVLAYSDEHGIGSHAIARLKTYCDLLQAKRINPTPNISIVREKGSVATVDGDNGLGLGSWSKVYGDSNAKSKRTCIRVG